MGKDGGGTAAGQTGIPFMITAAMKAQLRDLNYSDEAIFKMTPATAVEILCKAGSIDGAAKQQQNGGAAEAQADSISEATKVRLRLKAGGYHPIPVNWNKAPVLPEWQKKTDANDETIRLWEKLFPDATLTGTLTLNTPTFDIDIRNPDAAQAVEDLVKEWLDGREGALPIRIGQWPKRALLFRTDTAFKKLTVGLIAPDGSEERLEFLCNGQQVVVHGDHPITKQPYTWPRDPLPDTTHDKLILITGAEAQELFNKSLKLVAERFGYRIKTEEKKTKPKGNGTAAREDGHREKYDWSKSGDLLDHDKLTSVAMALIVGGLSKEATYNHLRALVEAIDTPDKERKQRRLDELHAIVDSAWAKAGKGKPEEEPVTFTPTPFEPCDPSKYPRRQFLYGRHYIRRYVSATVSAYDVGKTSLVLTEAVSMATNQFLLKVRFKGPLRIWYWGEDPPDEIDRRIIAICKHHAVDQSVVRDNLSATASATETRNSSSQQWSDAMALRSLSRSETR
jgi:hypothetical protein